jgi:hypothetical protein
VGCGGGIVPDDERAARGSSLRTVCRSNVSTAKANFHCILANDIDRHFSCLRGLRGEGSSERRGGVVIFRGDLVQSALMSLDGYIADENGRFNCAEPDEDVHRFRQRSDAVCRHVSVRTPDVRHGGTVGNAPRICALFPGHTRIPRHLAGG